MKERHLIRSTELIKKNMAQTIIKVPGMFEADEYGTPLIKASDIYDNAQSKSQSEINSELYRDFVKNDDVVDNVLWNLDNPISSKGVWRNTKPIHEFLNSNYTFAGVATPDTDPDDVENYGIFYLASEDGEYIHFLDGDQEPLVLSAGLNVLYKGVEDDGWYYWDIFGNDQSPTEDNENPVSSGGVYNAMNRMGGNLSDMIEVSGNAVNYQTMRVNNPFDAGDIFYINAPSGTTSEFVHARIYYVADKGGPEGILLTNTEYFTSTTSGAEAARLSIRNKVASVDVCESIIDELT